MADKTIDQILGSQLSLEISFQNTMLCIMLFVMVMLFVLKQHYIEHMALEADLQTSENFQSCIDIRERGLCTQCIPSQNRKSVHIKDLCTPQKPAFLICCSHSRQIRQFVAVSFQHSIASTQCFLSMTMTDSETSSQVGKTGRRQKSRLMPFSGKSSYSQKVRSRRF